MITMDASESTTNFIKGIADIISNYDISTILLIFSLLFFLLANIEKMPFVSLNNNSKIKIANYLMGSVLLTIAVIIAVNKPHNPPPITPPTPVTPNDEFKGINDVYIQYNNDQNKADKLKKLLQSKNIRVPPMEKSKERIGKNTIRYSNKIDKENADRLRVLLEQSLGIQFESPMDLSETQYRIPVGRFEIWLKD